MPDIPTDFERETAAEIAKQAAISGWKTAIEQKGKELEVSIWTLKELLDKVSKYNQKADPAGRIHELNDWENEKRGRSELAVGNRATGSF